ncbi:MAG: LexA family transcriptional regulator [Cytophagales bacterium]|nr:helix-turn-helix domain-containing protein [Bernardetiaceae bacterium]MDW8205002.1 LexA family transcriptional regulator [Cytophagales bacterium]
MEGAVSQRLMAIIKHFANGNEKRFAESIGVKPAVINNYTRGKQQSKPGFEVLQKMAATYPSLNIEWILSGKGQMLKQTDSEHAFAFNAHDTVAIPVINRRAAANYLVGYQTQEYFEELEVMNMPRSLLRGKQCYALQVVGDSMQPTLYENDYLICHLIDRAEWEYLSEGQICVIVSESGLQVKRIKNKQHNQYLTLVSDNPKHPPFKIAHEAIIEIWKVNWRLTNRLTPDSEDLHNRILQLEARLERVEKQQANL